MTFIKKLKKHGITLAQYQFWALFDKEQVQKVLAAFQPVRQRSNPDHPRVERRTTGISARQQRRDTRTVNRALSHYDI